MAKPKTPESQPSEQAPEEDFSRAHPLMRNKNQAEDLLEKALKRQHVDEFKVNEIVEWKKCVNAVAASEHGALLLKSMLQFSGVLSVPNLGSANQMVTNTIKGSFYLTWIRPYLNPEVRKEIE